MSDSKKILLLGAGGHCLSVLDSLIEAANYDEIGIVDKQANADSLITHSMKAVMRVPIVGGDDDLVRLHAEGYTDAFITIGSIGDITLRERLYQLIKRIGFHVPNIIDRSSVVSPNTSLGEGIYIGKNAVVNSATSLGNCAIINTSSVIEHECRIADFVHIAPGCILSGNVQIDSATHIGAGCVIRQGIHIGAKTMIGMGSIVLKDFGDDVTAYGNPCKEVKHE